MNFEWTEERVKTLKAMRIDGVTAGQIGKTFGISKSAVLGKMRRLGLAKKSERPTLAQMPREAKAKPTVDRPVKVNLRLPGAIPLAAFRERALREFVEPYSPGQRHTVGIPMALLGYNQCRFEVASPSKNEGYLFCGAPSDGSWCEAHRRIVYQPRTAGESRMVKDILEPAKEVA